MDSSSAKLHRYQLDQGRLTTQTGDGRESAVITDFGLLRLHLRSGVEADVGVERSLRLSAAGRSVTVAPVEGSVCAVHGSSAALLRGKAAEVRTARYQALVRRPGEMLFGLVGGEVAHAMEEDTGGRCALASPLPSLSARPDVDLFCRQFERAGGVAAGHCSELLAAARVRQEARGATAWTVGGACLRQLPSGTVHVTFEHAAAPAVEFGAQRVVVKSASVFARVSTERVFVRHGNASVFVSAGHLVAKRATSVARLDEHGRLSMNAERLFRV